MFARLLLLLLLLPFIELWLLLRFTDRFGLAGTLLLVVGSAMLGTTLARRQGLRVMQNMHRQTQQGQMPAAAMMDGMMISLAGLLLILPGLITDILGLALLIPLVRLGIRLRLADYLRRHAVVQVRTFGTGSPQATESSVEITGEIVDRDDVIDVEFEKQPPEIRRLEPPPGQ